MHKELLKGRFSPQIESRQDMERRIQEKGLTILNNFWTRIPGADFGDSPNPISSNRLELETAICMNMNLPYGQQLHNEGASELYLTLTPREFYGLVYSVLEDTGITKEKAIELRNKFSNGSMNIEEVTAKLVPAFLKLIEIGFSENDLSI
jgi:hypothetical protein